MKSRVKRAVLSRVSRLTIPSTPIKDIKEEKMPVFPKGAGVEMGLLGIGGARMAFTVAGGKAGLLVTVVKTCCDSTVDKGSFADDGVLVGSS